MWRQKGFVPLKDKDPPASQSKQEPNETEPSVFSILIYILSFFLPVALIQEGLKNDKTITWCFPLMKSS